MREAIFIQWPKDGQSPSIAYCQAEEAKARFKFAVANPPDGVEYVEVWTSDQGRIKRKNLVTAGRVLGPGKSFASGVKDTQALQEKEADSDGLPPEPTKAAAPTPAVPAVDPNDAGAVALTAEEEAELAETNNAPGDTNPAQAETATPPSVAAEELPAEAPATTAEPQTAPVAAAAVAAEELPPTVEMAAEKRAKAKAAKAKAAKAKQAKQS